ncbi:RagB/SusD family nutrient uptake outer membrane protein [Chitinophaga nivalis]|uniref:RagB/SusD family nutrient uptake outer membrane protein n=1 Tax=Chitinophaga nivalis TaxID=2991709 RepID=A0ABT3IHU6_9BACT|nr:RagB/SusD family nutrient uptake outer membrane protein [Chitinophaga nivalis]MCW3466939.1 RagB/SusD family nutrient uptake outer membrane protein [Chitinophaga nivalis]MCW3483370.1 RagB/SusD family nutrient uptake outer membrane protein [Chitinophaga nivalis]
MQRIKYITGILCAALLFTACKNVLDLHPQGNYTTGNYWRNQSDAVDGITGIYNILLEEDFTGFNEFVFNNCSDDQVRGGDHDYDAAIESFSYDASTYSVRVGWRWKYELINRANNALIYIPKITDIDAAIKNRCLGEARFLRAFAYWRLLLIYGEVPVITTENVTAGNYNQPKKSISEIRALIENDLLEAANLLPETYSSNDKGRVSKGTAWGLLCKFYLYGDQLDKAIEYGSKVTGNAHYALAPNYQDNFSVATGNNTEMLLAVQTLDGAGYSDFSTYHAPRAWGGWSFFYPTKSLVDEFENGDPRKDICIMKPGDRINIGTETATYTADLSWSGYHYNKFTSWKPSGGLNYSLKTPLLRSADVYLLVAEAKIRKSGPGAGDAEIMAVRKRAAASLPAVSGADMKALMHERRVELCGENERHQDLIRWDKAKLVDIAAIYKQPKLAYNGAEITRGGAARTFQRPKHYYFPLPQTDIDRSKGVLVQNPNY